MTAIAVYRGKNKVRQAAQIAAENGLRVPGWALERIYEDIQNYDDFAKRSKIALVYDDAGRAIAMASVCPTPRYVGYKLKEDDRLVSAFVREDYRGQGIGREVVKALSHTTIKKSGAGIGCDGSETFWSKVGVSVAY